MQKYTPAKNAPTLVGVNPHFTPGKVPVSDDLPETAYISKNEATITTLPRTSEQSRTFLRANPDFPRSKPLNSLENFRV